MIFCKFTSQSPINHPSITHQSLINHPSITHQSPLNHPSITHQSPINHLTITHQSPINHPSITHQSPINHLTITHQSPINHPSITHQSPHNHPSITHQSPINHPSITHQSPINHPSTTHQSPINHPSITHPPACLSPIQPSPLVYHPTHLLVNHKFDLLPPPPCFLLDSFHLFYHSVLPLVHHHPLLIHLTTNPLQLDEVSLHVCVEVAMENLKGARVVVLMAGGLTFETDWSL